MGAHKLHQGATGARRLMGRKLAFQLPEVVNQFARDDHLHAPQITLEEKMSDTENDLRSDILERLLNMSVCL